MHEADHAYPNRSTWLLHRLATDVPFIGCVIHSLSIFVYILNLSNFLSEVGFLHFIILSICFLLVCFVGAAGSYGFHLV